MRTSEPAGRAEIARSCGLSTQAVSNICESLVLDGLLREDGYRTGARGKPVMRYRFDGDLTFAIGIELRPDALITAVLSLSRERIYSNRIELADASPAHAVPLVLSQIDKAISVIGRDRSLLLGAGIVMPWSFGSPENSPAGGGELPGWEGVDAKQLFENALAFPVIVENDATAAAISERVVGIAADMDSFCFVYFGTGLGLGVISDGHARRGAFGNAGEIGHIITDVGGISCACGNRGCLEKYASRMSVRDHLARHGIQLPDSPALAQLLEQGNSALDDWMTTAAKNLSQAIGILENLFDPEAVILGGAMPDAV
ncbi:MAG: ROK family protein, partial [Paracoccaceae bacterium]